MECFIVHDADKKPSSSLEALLNSLSVMFDNMLAQLALSMNIFTKRKSCRRVY